MSSYESLIQSCHTLHKVNTYCSYLLTLDTYCSRVPGLLQCPYLLFSVRIWGKISLLFKVELFLTTSCTVDADLRLNTKSISQSISNSNQGSFNNFCSDCAINMIFSLQAMSCTEFSVQRCQFYVQNIQRGVLTAISTFFGWSLF